ncbi:MAG: hypothetical protein ABFD92_02165 [Planctomycetaceae bacterium]|nr:hypothetical protein [Planctomycetaceae bacterium]
MTMLFELPKKAYRLRCTRPVRAAFIDNPNKSDNGLGALRELLSDQIREVRETGWVTCPCGRTLHLMMAYKCLYCGLWFCKECATRHFGPEQTA